MNSAKEKKLNALKSEILEITNFVSSNKEDDNTNIQSEKEIKIDSNDTLTLTTIMNSKLKVASKEDLAEIKNELLMFNAVLTKQEIILKEILSKIKWKKF